MMMCDHWGTTLTRRRKFASLLYRHGYTMVAANILIQCMTESELDAEGLFWLGETLYAKGHNDQALSLFEQALEREPDMWQARVGATCMLHAIGNGGDSAGIGSISFFRCTRCTT